MLQVFLYLGVQKNGLRRKKIVAFSTADNNDINHINHMVTDMVACSYLYQFATFEL